MVERYLQPIIKSLQLWLFYFSSDNVLLNDNVNFHDKCNETDLVYYISIISILKSITAL